MPPTLSSPSLSSCLWHALFVLVGGLLLTGCGATAPVVSSINTPDTLETDESGSFRATLANREEADSPLRSTWNFGDGATARGRQTTHSYASPGRYQVSYRVRNEGGADTASASVTVVPQPRPPQIASINATPNPVDEGEPVRFEANVQGTTPLRYRWRFGDGRETSTRSPRHTYEEPGQYTARLTVSNEVGETSSTVSVRVNRTLPPVCTTISELSSAFFERNSSTLTKQARQGLAENADVLSKCPNLRVRIEGFAAPTERNAQALSSDRAQAVATFYRNNQVPARRITTRARGPVENASTKKGEQRQYRRADSIPEREGGM